MQHVASYLIGALGLMMGLFLFAPSESFGQEEGFFRTWRSGKAEFEAQVFERRGDLLVLIDRNGKKSKPVKIETLSRQDRQYLNGLKIVAADKAQYHAVMKHMSLFNQDPRKVLEELEEIAEKNDDSPYAKMMIGLAHATYEGKYSQAKRQFEAAIRIINAQRKLVGEQYHVRTLASLENNIALCALKMKQGDKAATHFLAGSHQIVPYLLHHNASILKQVSLGKSRIRFSSKGRQNLDEVVDRGPDEAPGFRAPEMYLFSLQWDKPMTRAGLSRAVGGDEEEVPEAVDAEPLRIAGPVGPSAVLDAEVDLARRGCKKHKMATGVLISSTLLLTNRHVVDSDDEQLSFTLTKFSRGGFPELVGGRVIKMSAFREQDLALIELEKPVEKATPVSLRQRNLHQDAAVTMVGFPDGFNGMNDVIGKMGTYSGEDQNNPWIYIAKRQGDQTPGGPCFDMNGDLVALTFGSNNDRFAEMVVGGGAGAPWQRRGNFKEGIGVSKDSIEEFVRSVIPDFAFEESNRRDFEGPQHLADSVVNSVMVVRSWKAPKGGPRPVANDRGGRLDAFGELMAMREKGVHPDIRCLTCAGRGGFVCKGCQGGGAIISTERVKVRGRYTNPYTPLYRHEHRENSCSQCGGRGAMDCRDCVNGVLPFRYPRN